MEDFLSPFSDFAPDVGATLRELEQDDSSNCTDSELSTHPKSHLIRLISDVERILSTPSNCARLGTLRDEWEDLLTIVMDTGKTIKDLADNPVGMESEQFSLELHRLSTLSRAAVVVSDIRSNQAGSDLSRPQAGGDSQTEPLEKMVTILRESERAQRAQAALLESSATETESAYARIVEEAFAVFSSECDRPKKSHSIEFALSTSHEELDSVKSTNSMRWLNDVLKWQVLDMNLQLRRRHSAVELRRLIETKKEIIREIMSDKVRQAMAQKKLELSKTGLDQAIDALYRISAASVSSTAASSPPTIEVFKQMVQSPQIKLDEAREAENFSDMNRCIGS